MNKEMLYKEISFIDDDLIEEAAAEKKLQSVMLRRVAAACAAVALICVSCAVIIPSARNGDATTVTDTDAAQITPSDAPAYRLSGDYELNFNTAQGELAKYDIFLGFSYEMSEAQKEAVFPGLSQFGDVEGVAAYDKNADLKRIFAELLFSGSELAKDKVRVGIRLYVGTESPVLDYMFEDQPQPSYINGHEVIAGQYEFYDGTIYFASFVKDGTAYALSMEGGASAQSTLSALAEWLICGGGADFSLLADPIVPELRDDELTEEQAYSEPDFGAYLPEVDISGLDFEIARRYIDQNNDYLSALWSQWKTQEYDELNILIRQLEEDDRARIVSPGQNERYDLSLYPIPRADSVPDELWDVVNDPIFISEEITLEEVYARSYYSDEPGDEGYRIDLSVLYGEVLVKIRSKGPSPEAIYDIIRSICE